MSCARRGPLPWPRPSGSPAPWAARPARGPGRLGGPLGVPAGPPAGARRSVSGAPALASVDDIVAQQVVEWEPAFRPQSRKLEVTGEKGLYAYVTLGGAAQVIATLLDNALVHGGGTVTIRTSQTPRAVVIEVRDEGKGVPPELVPRIFERSVSGAPGGTGLGLSLARTVAAADGGQAGLVRARPAGVALFLPHGVP